MTADFYSKVCHAELKYLDPGFDNLVTAVPKTDEVSLAYLQMLINGPFKAFSDLIGLHKLGDNYYILCSTLGKWPANVLYNFCIATRVPIEYPAYLPYWKELVDKGFNPALAFLLSYSVRGEPKLKHRVFPAAHHLWLDPSSDWNNILNGEMSNMTPAFKEYPKGCEPCNVIWGTSKDYTQISMMSAEEVCEYFKTPIEVPAPPPALKKKDFNKYIKMQLDAQAAVMQAAVQPAQGANPVGGPGLQWQWVAPPPMHNPFQDVQVNFEPEDEDDFDEDEDEDDFEEEPDDIDDDF